MDWMGRLLAGDSLVHPKACVHACISVRYRSILHLYRSILHLYPPPHP